MEQMLSNFTRLGYCPREPAGRRELPKNIEALNSLVPRYGSMNVLFEKTDVDNGR